MSAEYEYLNQLANYNSLLDNYKENLTFKNMGETSKKILEDNLIEGLGVPVSTFLLDKGVRGTIPIIKNKISALKNNEFLDDVQKEGVSKAIENKIAGVKKVVSDKVNDSLNNVKDSVETNINDKIDGVKSNIEIPNETVSKFRNKFSTDGSSDFSDERINKIMNLAKNKDEWHNTLREQDPNYNETEAEQSRQFINDERSAIQSSRMETQATPEETDLSEQAVQNLSKGASKGSGISRSDMALDNIGENVGEDVAEDVGEGAGELAADESIGAALDATGVLAPIGALVGLGGLIGSLFGIFDHHSAHAPPPPILGRPSMAIGA